MHSIYKWGGGAADEVGAGGGAANEVGAGRRRGEEGEERVGAIGTVIRVHAALPHTITITTTIPIPPILFRPTAPSTDGPSTDGPSTMTHPTARISRPNPTSKTSQQKHSTEPTHSF